MLSARDLSYGRGVPRGTRAALLALSLGFASITLDATALTVAIPNIGGAFHASVDRLQWVSSGYVIAYAGFLLSTGRMVDRYGARRALIVGSIAFAAASFVCAISASLGMLIAARFAQGVAGALVTTASFALLASTCPEGPARARGFAMLNLSGSIGLSAGPAIGGILTGLLSWRWIFALNVAISLAVLLGIRRARGGLPARDARSTDVIGQIASIVMLLALAAVLIRAGRTGWGDAWVLAELLVLGSSSVAFVLLQARGREPMLPLGLLRIAPFSVGTLACGAWRMSLYGFLFFVSLYLQRTLGWSTTEAGLAFLPITLAPIVTNALSAPATRRFGARSTAVAGFGLAATGAACLIAIPSRTSYLPLAFAMVLIGAGGGLGMPPLGSRALRDLPSAYAGVASGVFNAGGQTGSLIGIAVMGSFSLAAAGGGLARSGMVIAMTLGVAAIAIWVGFGRSPSPRATI